MIASLFLDPLPSSVKARAVGTAGAHAQALPSLEVASMCQGSCRGRNEGLRVSLGGDTPHGDFFFFLVLTFSVFSVLIGCWDYSGPH